MASVDPIVATKSVSRRNADAIEAVTSPEVASNACRFSDRTDERCATAAATEPATHTTSISHAAATTHRPREDERARAAPSDAEAWINGGLSSMATLSLE
jgi:hypothetical protein